MKKALIRRIFIPLLMGISAGGGLEGIVGVVLPVAVLVLSTEYRGTEK